MALPMCTSALHPRYPCMSGKHPGRKKKQNFDDLKCTGGWEPDTCIEECCEVDDTKCFSKRDTLDCGAYRKYDWDKNDVAHNNNPKEKCCKDWKNVCGVWKDEASSARNISVFAAWLATAMVA